MAAMKVILAAPRGFCAGVERAVVTVEKALEVYGAPVYVRRQIVHNRKVVADLEARGAVFVQDLDDVPRGATVVFAAHGVSPQVHVEAAARGLKAIDATCPMVAKVHREVRRFAAQDLQILLIGQAGHDEVIGTTGEAPERITLVECTDDVEGLVVADPHKVAWLSQTTLSVDETNETVDRLRAKFPSLIDPPSDDICYATQNRQSAAKLIATHSDVVIIVGSKNSSNSTRLAEVALSAGATFAYQIDDAREIDPSWFIGVDSVGIAAGASVPTVLIDGVLDYLEGLGASPATEEIFTEEDVSFSLPARLRKDPRGRGAS